MMNIYFFCLVGIYYVRDICEGKHLLFLVHCDKLFLVALYVCYLLI